MLSLILSLVFALAVIAIVWILFNWIVDTFKLPEPVKQIAIIIAVLVILLYIVNNVLPMAHISL